ncbi:NAD(P)-binding protein [Agrocybe pediades]|nr:NAD(P)-binding protein [Agrocybe pediades]
MSRLHPANLFDVEGLVAVVTGGGTGIGLIMAKALENNGATVYIIGRRIDVLQKAARENNNFDRIIPIEGDITNRDSLLSIVETIRTRHGYIDLLVNNAGIARNLYPHPLPSPTDEINSALWDCGSPEDFAETFLTNVTAVYYTTVAFLDLLHQGNIRRRRLADLPSSDGVSRPPHHTSQVLSVSSSGSFRIDSKVLSPSYTLSKSACTHLGKLLANLLAPWGIRSNVLAPGVWPSEMTTSSSVNVKLNPNALADSVPLRRVGTEEDMAGTILFLASQAGAYVNGAVWLVDGGRVGTVASNY